MSGMKILRGEFKEKLKAVTGQAHVFLHRQATCKDGVIIF